MTVDQAIEKSQSPYLAAFARAEIELAGSGPRRLEEIRREAIDRFADLGFPTTRDEEWKFTNLSPLTSITFDRASRAYDKHDVDALIRRLPETPNRLVFVNGYYAPELSSWRNKGIKLLSFQKAFEQQNAKFEQLLCRYADFRQHAFIALNTAFLADGAFVQIPAGAIIEEPILLLHISAGGAKPVVSYPRNLIVLGEHSQASIVETYIGLDGNSSVQPYFANAVTEIVEGEEAILDHYKLQMEAGNAFHIATIQAQVGRGGVFRSYAFNLGAALARTEINSVLEEGSDCTLNGLYVTRGTQHVDSRTSIDHAQPHATSHELYKGILDDHSSAVFSGRIIVRKDAQKTDAKQTNKNLVLSEGATINTKPELRIFADDVRCTHGATVGQLDAEAMFYLRSRGIELQQARTLLIQAFAREIIDGIRIDSFRNYTENAFLARLSQEAT